MKDPVYKPIQNVAHRSVKQDRMEKAFEDMLGVSDAIPLHNERFWNQQDASLSITNMKNPSMFELEEEEEIRSPPGAIMMPDV